ncbi:MAG: glucose-6-phosphate isomerase [Vigna little leaf phytoplasma]|nr:glucose-6-phosphate isomerase [Vigna little leaf phytoplasma]
MNIKFNINGAKDFINWNIESERKVAQIEQLHNILHYDQKLKKNFLGWIDLPFYYDTEEINQMKQIKAINNNLDILVVIGIGGSYIGIKSGIEFIKIPFVKNKIQIIFAGHQVSGKYLKNLIKYLKNKKWCINIISKSGTTLEPLLAFRILKKEIELKYGKEKAKNKIFVTTENKKNLLSQIAYKEGYKIFKIPSSIGGRFSILTVVGLFPFVLSGLNIDLMLKGAKKAFEDTFSANLQNNFAYQYALIRYLLYTKLNKKIEILVTYEPHLISFAEWWKQLFAESEGKENKGLFVTSVNNSTDLHSLGQFIQEGSKIMFETILNINDTKDDILIPYVQNELDNLNYLSGMSFSQINQKILKAVKQAHIEASVPNIEIIINNFNEYSFGYLVYFFEKACAMSGLLLGINSFNQPGVEIYKQKMLSLLKNR